MRFDGSTFEVFAPNEDKPNSLPESRVNCITIDSLKNIWLMLEGSTTCYRYDYALGYFVAEEDSLTPAEVKSSVYHWDNTPEKIAENEQYRWISNGDGIWQRNKLSGEQIHYLNDVNNSFSISDDMTRNVFINSRNQLWVGTQLGGVCVANLNMRSFKSYHMGIQGNGLFDNSVRAVAEDAQGRLWFASLNKGVTLIDRSNAEISYEYITAHDINIRSIYRDSNSAMWVGAENGLWKWNESDLVRIDTGTIQLNNLFSILEVDSLLLLGTFNRIYAYDRLEHSLENLAVDGKGMGFYIRDIVA